MCASALAAYAHIARCIARAAAASCLPLAHAHRSTLLAAMLSLQSYTLYVYSVMCQAELCACCVRICCNMALNARAHLHVGLVRCPSGY